MTKILFSLCSFLFFFLPAFVHAEESYANKRIFGIDSYHDSYEWTASVAKGIHQILNSTKIDLKTFHMDTKLNSEPEQITKKALEAKEAIDAFKPDVILASDDDATKYVIMPYYRNVSTPVVFSGINWDISVYQLPYANTTGMIEVSPARELFAAVNSMIKGKRISFLVSDQEIEHKEIANIRKQLGVHPFEERYVTTFEEWKSAFLDLQNSSNFVILRNNANLTGWNDAEAIDFVEDHTKVPTGALLDWMAPYALISIAINGSEQGAHMARTALQILDGASPKSIPIVTNKEGKIYLNNRIAKKMGITFPENLISLAGKNIIR